MNNPPSTLFDQFLKERAYLKNVSPSTLIWYQVAFKNFRATMTPDDAAVPTRRSFNGSSFTNASGASARSRSTPTSGR